MLLSGRIRSHAMNARVACAGSGPSSGSLAYEYWRVTWGSAGGSAYISTPASEAGLRGLQAAGLSSNIQLQSRCRAEAAPSMEGSQEDERHCKDQRTSIMIRESQARREMSDESCVGASRIRRAYPTSRCPWTTRLVLRLGVDAVYRALSCPSTTLVCVVCQRARPLSGH